MIILATMTKMSSEEVKRFLIQGTFRENLLQLIKMEVLMWFQFGLYWKMMTIIARMEWEASFLLRGFRQPKQEIFNAITGYVYA
jgi:hypothetical protein